MIILIYITVKTIAAPNSNKYYPLFQATDNSACFITTSSSSSLPSGRYLYTAYLVKVENDDIQYQISNSGECGAFQVNQARNTMGIGYYIARGVTKQTTSNSNYFQISYPTWYAHADGTVDYTDVLDKIIYNTSLDYAPVGYGSVIEWEDDKFKIITMLYKYVKTANDYSYNAQRLGVTTVEKNDKIMGGIASGVHAIALNSAKTNEIVRCLFSGSTKVDWAKSGWKVNTEGVRGYSPQDGIITADPYYWNMDNPDTIATQQDITENELENIATNQLYTDLDLSAIEQGQTQTELEIMILGG